MNVNEHVTLRVEKPAAGGRMIARLDRAVVLVAGAIPGEVVEAEVERVQRTTAWARTIHVVEPSPDRVTAAGDYACGGNVFAHVSYPRQLTLKREIIADAFARIAHLALPSDVDVIASQVEGYRMRARLHRVDGRIGFFREGTHELCDAGATRQLLPETVAVLRDLETALTAAPSSAAVHEVELSENCAADQRAVHLSFRDGTDPSRLGVLGPVHGVCGVSCGPSFTSRPLVLWGVPEVSDTITVPARDGAFTVTLARQAHSFFQGNRYLLAPLVAAVVDQVPPGRVLDLYAGVGLFTIALAMRGSNDVIAVEGDRSSAHDLKANAARVGRGVEARHQSVEAFLAAARVPALATAIVDPPRTGMTKDALHRVIALRPSRLVYVSCDVATLARDARLIVDRGYRLSRIQAFDLFPNTAHVETLAVFDSEDN